jgi:branched-chain amino acid transport system permease protein
MTTSARILLGAAAVILVLGVPLVGSSFVVTTAIAALYLAYQSLAWNLIGGLAGQFSLGNTIFIGAGAYTSSFLFVHYGVTPWVGIWAGAALAAVLAYLIGTVTFRLNLRGLYFAMVTLALAEMAQVLVENTQPLGAAYGILIPVRGTSLYAAQFESRAVYYYIILGMVVVAAVVMTVIQRGRLGLMLEGSKSNEDAAKAVGVPAIRNMQLMFALSAVLSALGGSFMAQYTLFIDPKSMFSWTEAVVFLLPAVIGGTRHWSGPILGAILLELVSDISRVTFGASVHGLAQIIYGVVVIVVVMRARMGIVDLLFERAQRKRAAAAADKAREVVSNAAP